MPEGNLRAYAGASSRLRRALLFLVKSQRRGVHAIAESRRFGTIGKYVPQVSVATPAEHLVASLAVAGVDLRIYVLRRDRRGEARPAGAGVEFHTRAKQRRVAGDTAIDAGGVVLVILAGESELGGLVARDREAKRSQPCPPF